MALRRQTDIIMTNLFKKKTFIMLLNILKEPSYIYRNKHIRPDNVIIF